MWLPDACDRTTCVGKCFESPLCFGPNGSCRGDAAPAGTPCVDGDAATTFGICTGASTCESIPKCAGVTCPPITQCFKPSTCIPTTGQCSTEPKPAGAPCTAGDNTTTDQCNGFGACVSSAKCAGVTCPAAADCLEASACDPTTGRCGAAPTASGTICSDDGDAATYDRCDGSGTCIHPLKCEGVTCPSATDCLEASACIPTTGQCSIPTPRPITIACDDGDGTTENDRCDGAGACRGTPKCEGVVCPSATDCIIASQCYPYFGSCSPQAPAPDGTPCNAGQGQCDGAGVCVVATSSSSNAGAAAGAAVGALLAAAVAVLLLRRHRRGAAPPPTAHGLVHNSGFDPHADRERTSTFAEGNAELMRLRALNSSTTPPAIYEQPDPNQPCTS